MVQRFASEIMKTMCCKCDSEIMYDFDVNSWFKEWQETHNRKQVPYMCAAKFPRKKCGAMTYVGCGHSPRMGKFRAELDGLVMDWCFEDGRLFAIWVLLSKYDGHELKLQARNVQKASVAGQNVGAKSTLKGTGYGNGSSWGSDLFQTGDPDTAYYGGGRCRESQALNFKQADEDTDNIIRLILGLVSESLPLQGGKNWAVPPSPGAMIELSILQDRAAELLRNDSLRNVSKRGDLYLTIPEFVERLGKHVDTSYLVREERYYKKRSAGLQALSTLQKKQKQGKSADVNILVLGSF